MAWFPGAIRKPITRHDTPMAAYRRYMLHTAVSAGSSLFNYFNQPGNPTSHFYVRADGTVEQYVDTRFRAPAQLEGNHDSVSIESQDMGGPFPSWSGSNVPAWTPQQVESIAKIGAWLHEIHGIKLQLCPNSRPGTEGFAYHRQGIDPWRVSNGEYWSSSRGKVCPGDRRVKQVPDVLARAKAIVGGDDMPLTDAEWTKLGNIVASKVAEELTRTYTHPGPPETTVSTHHGGRYGFLASQDAREANEKADQILQAVAASKLNVDALAAAIVAKMPTSAGSIDLATVKQGVREVLLEGAGDAPA